MSGLQTENEIKPRGQRDIYEEVVELSRPGASFYVMAALSAVIAAYGLLIGSPAVVIGAMLVAPLMGPIFGIALALVSGNRGLLRQALRSEIAGILISVGFAIAIGLVSAHVRMSHEWLSRTHPTLYDLVIALASGLAGAYALVDENISRALPGVAVSVALLPPLAACGLSVATGRWDLAGGAAMLFFANLLAIEVAGAVVFSLFGMFRLHHRGHEKKPDQGRRLSEFVERFGISILVLIVIGWFLTRTLLGAVQERSVEAQVDTTLSALVAQTPGAELSDFTTRRSGSEIEVVATVYTPRAFTSDQVREFEGELDSELPRKVHLIIRSVISRDVDRAGQLYGVPPPRPDVPGG